LTVYYGRTYYWNLSINSVSQSFKNSQGADIGMLPFVVSTGDINASSVNITGNSVFNNLLLPDVLTNLQTNKANSTIAFDCAGGYIGSLNFSSGNFTCIAPSGGGTVTSLVGTDGIQAVTITTTGTLNTNTTYFDMRYANGTNFSATIVRVANLESANVTVFNYLGSATTNISSLTSSVSSLIINGSRVQSNISTLTSNVSEIRTLVGGLTGTVTSVVGTQGISDATITTSGTLSLNKTWLDDRYFNMTNGSALKTRIDSVESVNTAQNTALDGLNLNDSRVQSNISILTGNVTAIRGLITSSVDTTNTTIFGNLTLQGSLLPSMNRLFSLGNVTYEWLNVYSSSAVINGTDFFSFTSSVNSNFSQLQNYASSANANISQLQNWAGSANSNITADRNSLSGLNINDSRVQSNISTLTSNVSEIRGLIVTGGGTVTQVDSERGLDRSTITSTGTLRINNSETVNWTNGSALKTRIDSVETTNTAQNTALDGLNLNDSRVQSNISILTGNVSAIRGLVGGLSGTVTSVIGTAGISDATITTSGTFTLNKTWLDDRYVNWTNGSAIKSRVDSIESVNTAQNTALEGLNLNDSRVQVNISTLTGNASEIRGLLGSGGVTSITTDGRALDANTITTSGTLLTNNSFVVNWTNGTEIIGRIDSVKSSADNGINLNASSIRADVNNGINLNQTALISWIGNGVLLNITASRADAGTNFTNTNTGIVNNISNVNNGININRTSILSTVDTKLNLTNHGNSSWIGSLLPFYITSLSLGNSTHWMHYTYSNYSFVNGTSLNHFMWSTSINISQLQNWAGSANSNITEIRRSESANYTTLIGKMNGTNGNSYDGQIKGRFNLNTTGTINVTQVVVTTNLSIEGNQRFCGNGTASCDQTFLTFNRTSGEWVWQ